jgi:hypothetical protein
MTSNWPHFNHDWHAEYVQALVASALIHGKVKHVALALVECLPERFSAKCTFHFSAILGTGVRTWDKASCPKHAKERTERASMVPKSGRHVYVLRTPIPSPSSLLTYVHFHSHSTPFFFGQVRPVELGVGGQARK